MKPALAMIAAVAANGVIGSGNTIPWYLPSDFGFFKRMTLGKPLIMGRKTFESIGKPLPGRTNIVVTREAGYQPEGVLVISDLNAALDHAASIAETDRVDEIMIGGGGALYEALMPRATRLYISHVDLRPQGDVFFPAIDPALWTVVDEPSIEPNIKDTATFRTRIYERRSPASH
jgi:dihydrofolate reductase